jgi:hypothetical protein
LRGSICSVCNSYLRFNQPNSMFAAMSFGNCGYAFHGEALQKACGAQKKGKTVILDVHMTMELGDPFHRDALKKPQRLLDKHTNVA